MKRKIIYIHTIIQLVFLIIFDRLERAIRTSYSINEFITSLDNPTPPSFIEKYQEAIIIGLALIIFSISFIILGLIINRTYQYGVNYWRHLYAGMTTSLIALCIFYLIIKFEETRPTFNKYGLDQYFRSVLKHIYIIPLYSIFLILVCAITAFTFVKFKRQNNSNNKNVES